MHCDFCSELSINSVLQVRSAQFWSWELVGDRSTLAPALLLLLLLLLPLPLPLVNLWMFGFQVVLKQEKNKTARATMKVNDA